MSCNVPLEFPTHLEKITFSLPCLIILEGSVSPQALVRSQQISSLWLTLLEDDFAERAARVQREQKEQK